MHFAIFGDGMKYVQYAAKLKIAMTLNSFDEVVQIYNAFFFCLFNSCIYNMNFLHRSGLISNKAQ